MEKQYDGKKMLKRLEISDFRNYLDLRLDFGRETGLTYVIGDNGQGKTNILEAIYMLALAKSFRVSDEQSLIRWGAEYGRVKGFFGQEKEGIGEKGMELELFLGQPPQPRRVFKVNKVKKSAIDFVGRVRVVFFHPEDLNMLYLGPDLRRRYLDIMILQRNSKYFAALRNYQRIRTQRNALLLAIKERRAVESGLEVWNEQLAKEGALIWKWRGEALKYIDQNISDKYREISGKQAQLRAKLVNNLDLGNGIGDWDLEEIEGKFRQELEKIRSREIISTHTLLGPHRDDIDFYLNERVILEHASRGEFRTILLALKLIEVEYFSQDEQKPILLLDDVFSELDHERQRFLLEKVVNYQTFITTTKDSVIINREKLLAGNFIEIKEGKAFF